MSNFAGRTRASVQQARFVQILIATNGVPFTNASGQKGSVDLGMRKPGKITIKPESLTDVAGRPIPNMYLTTIELEGYQNRIVDWLNAYLLCNVEFSQVLIKDMSGKYWNFIAEAGTYTVPTASQLLGGSYEVNMTQKDRFVKYTFTVLLTSDELQWLVTNNGSAQTGGAGTTTLPFVTGGYSRANHYRTGVGSISIGGHDVGIIDDSFSLVMKSKAQGKPDHRGRPLNNFSELDIKFGLKQTADAEMNAVLTTLEETDCSIVFNFLSGETFTITSGAALGEGTRILGEDDRSIDFEIKGTFPNNSVEATPTSIDLGVTSPTAANVHLIGYDGTI